MKLSLILEAIDRASRPLDRVDRATGGLGRSASRSANDVRTLDRRMEGASRSAGRMERAARGIGGGLAAASRRGIGALAALDRRLSISRARMEKLAFSAGTLIGSTIRGGVVAGGAIAGAGLSAALYKIVAAGTQIEKFRMQLEGTEGSTANAAKSLQWISAFAAKTPFSLDEVTEAFIKARNSGINPMTDSLQILGDAGAALNKSYVDSIDMLADAMTFQFDRTLEFGIRASQEGAKVTLNYVTKTGKQAQLIVKKDALAVQAGILKILNEKFGGGMERLSKTTEGKWQGLMDRLGQSAVKVWDGGVGAAVNRQLDRMVAGLEQAEKSGQLDAWAEKAGKGIGDFVDAMASADWPQIGRDISGVAQAIGTLANGLAQLERYRQTIRNFQRGAEYYTGGGLLGGIENGSYVAPRWLRDAPKPAAPLPRRIPNAPLQPQAAPRAPLARPARQSPMLPGRPSIAWPAAAAPKGKLEISIKTDAGTTAKPTKVAAKNMDIDVATGRQMAGPA